jgi:hypothetical protein
MFKMTNTKEAADSTQSSVKIQNFASLPYLLWGRALGTEPKTHGPILSRTDGEEAMARIPSSPDLAVKGCTGNGS